jgi:hypothetical protein
MTNFLPIYPVQPVKNSQNTKYNGFNAINIPYGYGCLLPSNQNYRQGAPGPDVFGDGIHYTECIPKLIQPGSVIGPQNNLTVNNMDTLFFREPINPAGSNASTFNTMYQGGPTNLQSEQPKEPSENYYVSLASDSLHAAPDLLMFLFFSDSNINHIRNTIVQKVKEITGDSGVAGSPEGVVIKPPHMDDLFYYMVNIFKNYKIFNGSICFINLQNKSDTKAELIKLNSDILQEYISKLVSQINMYIYYYKDASQLPQQMSLPAYNSMKGSRSLEYNTGFQSGNSTGVASYNEVGNIF